jgi:hypothetical protein
MSRLIRVNTDANTDLHALMISDNTTDILDVHDAIVVVTPFGMDNGVGRMEPFIFPPRDLVRAELCLDTVLFHLGVAATARLRFARPGTYRALVKIAIPHGAGATTFYIRSQHWTNAFTVYDPRDGLYGE